MSMLTGQYLVLLRTWMVVVLFNKSHWDLTSSFLHSGDEDGFCRQFAGMGKLC